MKARGIIRAQLRALLRRVATSPWWMRLSLALFLAGAVSSAFLGMAHLAALDLAATDPGAAVRERVFWLTTLMILVFGYTTFETLFRSRDQTFLCGLPLAGAAWYGAMLMRATALHSLLLVPLLGYAFALSPSPLGDYALLWGVLTLAMGLPTSLWLHMMAGNSLLGGASALKQYLGGGLASAESTFLLYSPVAALAANMGVAIFNDLFLYESLITHRVDLVWLPIAWTALAAFLSIKSGLAVADRAHFAVVAAFREAEAPLPYHDDGLPRGTAGLGFGRLMPRHARAYFERDLRQLRRRYRVDKVLLWLYALVLLRLNSGLEEVAFANLLALGTMIGLLLVSAFRLFGDELASPWLSASLPRVGRSEALGRWAASVIHPLWAWAVTVVVTAFGGTVSETLVVAGGGLAVLLILTVLSQLLARASFPGRTAMSALAWRFFLLCVIGVVAWQHR